MATPRAGHAVVVKFFNKADTASLTIEPLTSLGGGVFQITDATKRVLDPDGTFTFDGDRTLDAIDYLFGKFTLSGGTTDPTEVTGAFIPEDASLNDDVMGASVTLSRTVLDSTPFNLGGDRRKLLGLNDSTITFQFHGGMPGNIDDWASKFGGAQLEVLAEIDFGDGQLFRAWTVFSTDEISAPIDELLAMTVTLEIASHDTAQAAFGPTKAFAFGS